MPKLTINRDSSAKRFGSPGTPALPNALGLWARQLCQTLRVSGRKGSSANCFGSPGTAMKVILRDQKIQFGVSCDQLVRLLLFFDILSQLCACRTQCPKMSQCKIFSFLMKRSNLTQIFACHNDVIRSSPGWVILAFLGPKH